MLSNDGFQIWKTLSKESSEYLNSIDYNSRYEYMSPTGIGAGGLGLTDSIEMLASGGSNIFAHIKALKTSINLLLYTSRVKSVNKFNNSLHEFTVSIEYTQAISKGNPLHPGISHARLILMLETGYYLHKHLQVKYPNFRFTLNIQVRYEDDLSPLQSYTLRHSQVVIYNIIRLRKLSAFTPFSRGISKNITMTKLGLIKRTDSAGAFKHTPCYFIHPDILIDDLIYSRKLRENDQLP